MWLFRSDRSVGGFFLPTVSIDRVRELLLDWYADTDASCPGARPAIRTRSSSPRSCSSRRRSPASSLAGSPGSSAGRPPRRSPPRPRARCFDSGKASATTAGRSVCSGRRRRRRERLAGRPDRAAGRRALHRSGGRQLRLRKDGAAVDVNVRRVRERTGRFLPHVRAGADGSRRDGLRRPRPALRDCPLAAACPSRGRRFEPLRKQCRFDGSFRQRRAPPYARLLEGVEPGDDEAVAALAADGLVPSAARVPHQTWFAVRDRDRARGRSRQDERTFDDVVPLSGKASRTHPRARPPSLRDQRVGGAISEDLPRAQPLVRRAATGRSSRPSSRRHSTSRSIGVSGYGARASAGPRRPAPSRRWARPRSARASSARGRGRGSPGRSGSRARRAGRVVGVEAVAQRLATGRGHPGCCDRVALGQDPAAAEQRELEVRPRLVGRPRSRSRSDRGRRSRSTRPLACW